ncbi:MAG TPA: competence type IV pilus minor pilin ComGG [Bacillales bacterium]|nr:competence type IV pilus minor pilin ComGG [Bacillales bacterium]
MSFCLTHLRRSEKGFVLPLTMVVALLLTGYALFQWHMYDADKRFLREKENSLRLSLLIESGIADFAAAVERNHDHLQFTYKTGSVSMKIENRGDTSRVTLRAETKKGESRTIRFQYDKINDKIMAWKGIEGE